MFVRMCPWNSFSLPHQESLFEPSAELVNMEPSDWQEMTEETFKRVFKNSAVKRTKFQGLKRNLKFIHKK